MFMTPEMMMPRGPDGRGCGRGRGMGRGGFGMGRGGMGRPDPRWMDCGGPQCGPDPRQMAYGGMYPGYGAMGCPPFQGPPAMWGPPHMMPWAGYTHMGGPPHMPWFGPFGGGGPRRAWRFHKLMEEMQQAENDDDKMDAQNVDSDKKNGEEEGADGKSDETRENQEGAQPSTCHGCCAARKERWGRHGHQGRPRFMRRLHKFLAQMEDASDSSSDSDDDVAATPERQGCEHKRKHWRGKKGCRRAWRMRHQFQGGPPGPFYGGGPPMMGWSPAWTMPVGGGCPPGPPGRPGLPPHLLQRLRRLLAALESETSHQGNSGNVPTSEGQTGSEHAQGQTADTSCRRARLQARLRRLIDHIERQNENQDSSPSPPWMRRMQAGTGCGRKPRHIRRMLRQMRRAEMCQSSDVKNDEGLSVDDVKVEGASGGDVTMTVPNPGPLEDWENLRSDVEHLQTIQHTVPQDSESTPSQSKCPTCHRAPSPEIII